MALSKCSDLLYHDRLITKLAANGFDEISLAVVETDLRNVHQRIKIGLTFRGGPQGSTIRLISLICLLLT